MSGLKVWYGAFSHTAGPERRVVLHAVDVEVAERMGWAGFAGSRQFRSLTLIEATSFASLESR